MLQRLSLVFAFALSTQVVAQNEAPTMIDRQVPYPEMLSKNRAGIAKLSTGMTREQVVAVMGNSSSRVRDGVLSNPWKTDAFVRDGESYEVLHYLTGQHTRMTRISEGQATPVVLKNGAVVGWGRAVLDRYR